MNPANKVLLKDLGVAPSKPGSVGHYEDFFEVTSEGEVVNLNEYSAWIADTREAQQEEIANQRERWAKAFERKNFREQGNFIFDIKSGVKFESMKAASASIRGKGHAH